MTNAKTVLSKIAHLHQAISFRMSAALKRSRNQWTVVCLILLSAGLGHANSDVQPVKHVIIIMQENRTPDNLLHGLPNADIANSGIDSKGHKIELTPIPLANDYDLDHHHESFKTVYHHG